MFYTLFFLRHEFVILFFSDKIFNDRIYTKKMMYSLTFIKKNTVFFLVNLGMSTVNIQDGVLNNLNRFSLVIRPISLYFPIKINRTPLVIETPFEEFNIMLYLLVLSSIFSFFLSSLVLF